MSIKYGINLEISLEEYRETPKTNQSFFNISKEKQEQAIKNAQKSWDTLEVSESLKRKRKTIIYQPNLNKHE